MLSVLQIDIDMFLNSIAEDLLFPSLTDRLEAIPQHYEATYNWIFSRQPKKKDGEELWSSFPNWLERDNDSMFWITGKPGSGKSTIMKHIAGTCATVQHLSRWSGSMTLLTLSYYAWNSGSSLQKSWEGLKRTFLHQVLKHDPKLLPVIFPRRWTLLCLIRNANGFPPCEPWEIEESLDFLLKDCGKTIKLAIFIDGLDEFDLPAVQLSHLIWDISRRSTNAIKFCIASRPWTEFEDTFHSCPKAEMHLLTHHDIKSFVTGKLHDSRGFQEMVRIFPDETTALAERVISKSQGVFLWVTLVVDELLNGLSEGARLSDIQVTLELLPESLSSLYDIMWNSIKQKHRDDASWMIRTMATASWPLEWFSMWLADESRATRVDVMRLPNDVKYDAKLSMKRRLATRTKGILEISGKTVSFLHRTARDWARESRVSDMISSTSNCDIDQYMMLAEAESLGFSYPVNALDYSHDSIWEAVYKVLWYASHVKSQGENVQKLIKLLDYFDQRALQTWLVAQQNWPESLKLKNGQHWAEKQNRAGKGRRNTFLGITIQFAILPYAEAKIRENKGARRQVTSKEWVGLLENAEKDFLSFMSPDFHPNDGLPDIPAEKEEAMLVFLHSQGFGRWGESIGSSIFRSISRRLRSRHSRQ